MSHISLEHIDHTGALREMADGVDAIDGDGTRRALLRKAGMTGAGFVAGGVLFNGLLSPAEAAGIAWKRRRSNGNDVKIANYALTLEYLETAFYKAAIDSGVVTDPDAVALAKTIHGHEAAHVKALKQALGKAAVKSPKFDFSSLLKDQKTVLTAAAAVEPVGVSAYAGRGRTSSSSRSSRRPSPSTRWRPTTPPGSPPCCRSRASAPTSSRRRTPSTRRARRRRS